MSSIEVLLVDRYEANLIITEMVFKEAGFPVQIEQVFNLKEALDYLTGSHLLPDIIIIDSAFLNVDAHLFFIQMKTFEAYKKISIAVTVFDEAEIWALSLNNYPIEEFILKPMDMNLSQKFIESVHNLTKGFVLKGQGV